jgi:PEGA domain
MTRAPIWIALLVLAAAPAAAVEPRVEAERLTEQGARAYGRGDYAAALELFRKSYAIYASPNTHSNLARALLKLERRPEAMEEFESFLAEATGVSGEAHDFALAKKTELAAQLGKLTIEADAGAEVSIDGRPVGKAPLARARWVTPGAHTVSVAAPGRAPFSERVELGPGGLREIRAVLRGGDAPPPIGPPPVGQQPPPNEPPPTMQQQPPSNEPPPATPPSTWRSAPRERAGRWMLNAKLGFSQTVYLSVDQPLPLYFTFTIEAGFAICCHRQLYLVFPFSIQYKDFGGGATNVILELPLGAQYDLHLVNALYLTLQLSIGYAVVVRSSPTAGDTIHGGVIRPTAGVKYVIAGRGNVGIDVFNLPILFNQDGVGAIEYRMMFYGGVNF